MPWKDTSPMDERKQSIDDYKLDMYAMNELCERYGISRKTGYKWHTRASRTTVEEVWQTVAVCRTVARTGYRMKWLSSSATVVAHIQAGGLGSF